MEVLALAVIAVFLVVAAIEDEVLVQTQSEYVALTEEEIEELIEAGVLIQTLPYDVVDDNSFMK